MHQIFWTATIALILNGQILPTEAAEKTSQIPVSLFGNKCTLEGPFDTATLKAIHNVSPEQNASPQNITSAKKCLDHVAVSGSKVSDLKSYSEKLKNHCEAMKAFYEGLAAAKKSAKEESFLKKIEPFTAGKNTKSFQATLKSSMKSLKEFSTLENLKESYLLFVENYPESDFHKLILKIKVKYNCSMEGGEEDEDNADEEDDTAPVEAPPAPTPSGTTTPQTKK